VRLGKVTRLEPVMITPVLAFVVLLAGGGILVCWLSFEAIATSPAAWNRMERV